MRYDPVYFDLGRPPVVVGGGAVAERQGMGLAEDDSLEARVGNTPLLPLKRVTADLPPSVHVLAKAEWFNPSGSVKDRPALYIIRQALRAGALDPAGGKRLLDSTSGNMGIGYATFCAARGIGVTLVVQADRLCGKLDFPAIIAGNGHLDFLQGRVGKEEGQVAARQTELSARQDELGQALQRRRVLEKLQERQKFQHNKDEERREAMLLDGLPVPERR